jgi:hypothetical protein
MWDLSNSFVTLDNAFYNLSGISNLPAVAPTVISNGGLDVYDKLNGSVLLAWGEMLLPAADSYNVYVNGVLVANVSALTFEYRLENGGGDYQLEDGLGDYVLDTIDNNFDTTVSNLTQASYNPASQVITPSGVYTFNVCAVDAGTEIVSSRFFKMSPSPTSVMLVTPMKRIFPFPNTGLN